MSKKNVLELIGNTPMVKLSKLVPAGFADVFAKLEYFNPGGSVKDRICLSMIEDAEAKGLLRPGAAIIEPTSGNTGIGLAMVGAVKGYKVILVMPDTMSLERRAILDSYGAQVVLTPGMEGMEGALKKAKELAAKTPNSFMPQQFINPANPDAHKRTTAREILEQSGGGIDAFVAGVGTGGTITGVAEVLKKELPKVKIYAVEPSASAVLSGGSPGPHKIQGLGAGFIPQVLDRKRIDEVITVMDGDAFQAARRLAREEGVLGGISSGAACWAAIKVAGIYGGGKKVVTIFPDGGERYLSVEGYLKV